MSKERALRRLIQDCEVCAKEWRQRKRRWSVVALVNLATGAGWIAVGHIGTGIAMLGLGVFAYWFMARFSARCERQNRLAANHYKRCFTDPENALLYLNSFEWKERP